LASEPLYFSVQQFNQHLNMAVQHHQQQQNHAVGLQQQQQHAEDKSSRFDPTVLVEADLKQMLACRVHLGSTNVNQNGSHYVEGRRKDGVHLIHLGKTWEKLMMAARMIVAVENPNDIIVVCARTYGQRACLKFAQQIGAQAVVGRFTPGTFTNALPKTFREPRLVILTDPATDHQACVESRSFNIAFCNTDSPFKNVDLAVPCNNRGNQSVGLLYWLLARAVLRMRGTLSPYQHWNVMVDMFFYREPEEVDKENAAKAGQQQLAQQLKQQQLQQQQQQAAIDAQWDGAAQAPEDAAWEAGVVNEGWEPINAATSRTEGEWVQ